MQYRRLLIGLSDPFITSIQYPSLKQMLSYILLALSSLTASAQTTYMYVFAQEWPGSVCKVENCQSQYMGRFDARRWNIHGLWPNTVLQTSCGQISNCRAEAYDPGQLSPMTTQAVDLAWNGLYSDTNGFRKHEWEKHGTCYPGQVSQNTYFSQVTSLAENYNFYNILAAAGIYPDNNRKLTDSEVRAAFASRLGSAATINYTCAKDANGNHHLAELRICFKENLQPRTCNCSKPVNSFVTCAKTFFYPVYNM